MFEIKPILARLAAHLRLFWWVPLATTALAVTCAAIYLSVRTPVYDVSMLIAPASPPGSGSSGSILRGGAASLLGLNMSSTSLDKYQQILTSERLAASVATDTEFFHEYFSREWDPGTQTWHPPPNGLLAALRRTISEMFGAPGWTPPTPARMANDFQRDLVFSPVGRSDLLRVSVRTMSPEFSVKLLTLVNKKADAILREMERTRVNAYLAYLNREIPNVQNSENRTALSDLILEQQRQLMSLNSESVPFATQVIQPPTIPYLSLGMRPLPMLALSIILGFLAGLGLVYWLPSSARERQALP